MNEVERKIGIKNSAFFMWTIIGLFGYAGLVLSKSIPLGHMKNVLNLLSAISFGSGFGMVISEIRYRLVKNKTSVKSLPNEQTESPKPAQLLLYLLLPKKQREAVIGDLEEQYTEACQRLGKRGADIWYFVEVMKSVWPILAAWGKKLLKLGGAAFLGHWLHKLIP